MSDATLRKARVVAAVVTLNGVPFVAVAAEEHRAPPGEADHVASGDHGAAEAHHAGSEEAHGHGAHVPSVSELLFPTINFALFAVIIVKYVIPALREYLRRRADDVTTATTQAGAALAEAEASLTAMRARSSAVASERDAIRGDMVTAATRQAERLRQQAEETGKRRLADAALVAEQERRRALLEVRAEIATLATELAESRLRAVLSPADQRAFIDEFLKEAPSR